MRCGHSYRVLSTHQATPGLATRPARPANRFRIDVVACVAGRDTCDPQQRRNPIADLASLEH